MKLQPILSLITCFVFFIGHVPGMYLTVNMDSIAYMSSTLNTSSRTGQGSQHRECHHPHTVATSYSVNGVQPYI